MHGITAENRHDDREPARERSQAGGYTAVQAGQNSPAMPMRTGQLLGVSIWAVALLLGAVGLLLFLVDPAQAAIYPVCYFHRLTGLQCPGCGGLRAAHQLLHGHLLAAWRLNAFLVLSLPLLGLVAGRGVIRVIKSEPGGFAVKPSWLWAGLALLLGFGIARNLL